MLLEKTKEEILNNILNEIKNSTNLTNITRGSFIYKLANAFAQFGYDLELYWNNNFIDSLLQYATGENLDIIGKSLNVYRKQFKSGTIYETDRNFYFYVDSGTFGDINNGNDIIVPSGTIIYTDTDINGNKIEFILLSNVVLLATESKHYFSAEAVSNEQITIGNGVIKYHTFSGYADVINNSLKVTNENAVTIGEYIESDDDYRYRIANSFSEFATGNNIAITLKAMEVPGVADVKIIDFERGAGSASVYIQSKYAGPDDKLINIVARKLNQIKSLGTDLRVYNPVYIGIEIEVELQFKYTTQADQKEFIKLNVLNNIKSYINNLRIGEPLYLQQLISIILETSDEIIRVGKNDTQFNILNIYKTNMYGQRYPQEIISDIYVEPYEKIIVEYTLTNPIKVI